MILGSNYRYSAEAFASMHDVQFYTEVVVKDFGFDNNDTQFGEAYKVKNLTLLLAIRETKFRTLVA